MELEVDPRELPKLRQWHEGDPFIEIGKDEEHGGGGHEVLELHLRAEIGVQGYAYR